MISNESCDLARGGGVTSEQLSTALRNAQSKALLDGTPYPTLDEVLRECVKLSGSMKVRVPNIYAPNPTMNDQPSKEDIPRQFVSISDCSKTFTVRNVPDIESIRTESEERGAAAERQRILAELAKIAPTESYTRREWQWEAKGAQAMLAKVEKIVSGESVKEPRD